MAMKAIYAAVRPGIAFVRDMEVFHTDRPANCALAGSALAQLFTEARSYNRWRRRELEDARIRELYETAAFGPTSVNGNPARFVWARSPEARRKLADCVNPGNAAKVMGASATVIVGYDPNFYLKLDRLMPHAAEKLAKAFADDPREAHETAFRNSSLQGAYLIMAARALGFDCGPMSGFDHARVNAAFFAGTEIRANFICAIGWGSTEALMPRNPRLPFAEVNTIL